MPVNKKKGKSKQVKSDRKRRIRKHVIADLSANHVEKFALLNGFSVECIGKDYGYDLNIYTFDSKGRFENGNIYVQLKATDNPLFVSNNKEISYPTDKRDLRTWFEEPLPVIFILFDAKNDKAYWVYIQQYLRNLTNFDVDKIADNYSVRIPVVNIIDKNSFQLFRSYKANVLKEITNVITYK